MMTNQKSDTDILNVDLGERSYPIYIGENILGQAEIYKRHIRSSRVMIVTNETVEPLYLDQVDNALADYDVSSVVLPDGEQYKSLDVLNRIFDRLLQEKFDRHSTLIALGGGVVGDMTGFAAACYQRGINFVQVPTTLLSQVDSSVGGKTGVNHPLGKNMIGAFFQPNCVIADIGTLRTLERRQIPAGLAEIIKYGAIDDAEFFDWLEQNIDALNQLDSSMMRYAVRRSCSDKADVVAADEKESGKRAILNFGHTFGHAIETGEGYGEWLHGEAVGTGMIMAAEFSARLGMLSRESVTRITHLIEAAGLPVKPPTYGAERYLDLMSVDKKVRDGNIRFVLLNEIGSAVVTGDYDREILIDLLDEY